MFGYLNTFCHEAIDGSKVVVVVISVVDVVIFFKVEDGLADECGSDG